MELCLVLNVGRYIVKDYCHICGKENPTKIGIWKPQKTTLNGWFNYLFKKQEEYDVPLCKDCHERIYQKLREMYIVGVRL